MKISRGFTLTEVVVYTAIVLIIFLVLSSFVYWTVRIQNKVRAMREVSTNAERVLTYIANEIKEAKSVYTPTSNFDISPGQLSLETTKYLPAGETNTYIDFYQCDNQICMKKEGQNPIALSPDNLEVTHLEFHQVATTANAPSIQVHMIVKHMNPQNVPEQEAQIDLVTTASLRSNE